MSPKYLLTAPSGRGSERGALPSRDQRERSPAADGHIRPAVSRRDILRVAANGFGAVALEHLLQRDLSAKLRVKDRKSVV